MRRYLPFAIIGIVLIGTVLGGILAYRSGRSSALSSSLNTGISGAEPPHARGSESAPAVLEEFGDYQCPPCGVLHPELKKLESEYGPQRLRFIFRNFPLLKMHPHALEAAHAAEAAGLQNRFWEMHDALYENQKAWGPAPDVTPFFMEYAHNIGLDAGRFSEDLNSSQASMRVVLDMRRAESLGVKATPTLFLNNVEIPSEQVSDMGLHAAIDSALGLKRQ